MNLFLAMLLACLPAIPNGAVTKNVLANPQEVATQSGSHSEQLAKADQLDAEVVKLFSAQEYEKALVLARQVVETRERILGPDHLMVALSLQNVAELLIAKKKPKEAGDVYRRSFTIYEKVGSGKDPKLIRSLERYICLLTTIGRSDEINEVRKRLFKLENGFDESTSAPGQNSKSASMQGRALSLPKPEYSAEARAGRLSGSVVIKIRIDEAGKVVDVKSICGHPLLVKGSEPAVWKARFEPAVVNGQPAPFISTIIYNFVYH